MKQNKNHNSFFSSAIAGITSLFSKKSSQKDLYKKEENTVKSNPYLDQQKVVEVKTEETVKETVSTEPVENEIVNDIVVEKDNSEEKNLDASQVKTAIDPETGLEYTFDEKGIPVPPEGMLIRYKWSFLARLAQSDNDIKFKYMILRRILLSYEKVRSNVSWNFDTYFIGRKTICKIKIRGKNIVVYFPLDPKSMEGTKYLGEDVSKVSRYKTVPFAYKINGNRKLKYAVELIRQSLEGINTKEQVYINPSNIEKAIPKETFEELFNKGYIRIGGFLKPSHESASSDDDDDDISVTNEPIIDEEKFDLVPLSDLPVEKEEFNFNPIVNENHR